MKFSVFDQIIYLYHLFVSTKSIRIYLLHLADNKLWKRGYRRDHLHIFLITFITKLKLFCFGEKFINAIKNH